MSTLIIFDFYRTLVYKKGLHEEVQKFLLDELNVNISNKYLRNAFNIMYNRYKFHPLKHVGNQAREEFYKKYNREMLNIIGLDVSDDFAKSLNGILKKLPYACYEDTIPMLKFFKSKRKYSVGMISNWTETLDEVLKDLSLKKYFDFFESSHNIQIEKPDPELFKKVIKDFKGNYQKIYYVGDDYELDVLPARKASLEAILIDRDNIYPKSVDCIKVNALSDLKEVIA